MGNRGEVEELAMIIDSYIDRTGLIKLTPERWAKLVAEDIKKSGYSKSPALVPFNSTLILEMAFNYFQDSVNPNHIEEFINILAKKFGTSAVSEGELYEAIVANNRTDATDTDNRHIVKAVAILLKFNGITVKGE